MADSKADEYIRDHNQLASKRSTWESHWTEIAERVRPSQNYFNQKSSIGGEKKNEKIFDDTAPLALPKFAAAVISMVMPATQTYHVLKPHDSALEKNAEVRRYMEEVNTILFKHRYAPSANFQSQSAEAVLDVGAFGTGVLFIDDVIGKGIRYKSFPLSETYLAEDAHGKIDTMHRKFNMTAHQAITLFGMDKVSESIQRAYQKDKTEEFEFLHCVVPNLEKKSSRRDYAGMDFSSCYIEYDKRIIVSEGGFRRFPFATPRFETSPREVYGRSPAMKVLPTIKTLNEMSKTILRAAQKVVQPPIMLTEDASLQAFNVRPDALNYGYVDNNGRALAQPFQSNARVDIGLDMLNQMRDSVNDAFFVTLFRILVQEPTITATEAMLRAQEKGQLLAPTMGRMQSEMLNTVVERELDIHQQAGRLPPMPQALVEAGGIVKIEYTSPLNQAQRAGSGVAIMNTIQAITPLAQVEPKVLLVFDMVKAAREIANINGVPEKVMNSEEDVLKLIEADNQKAQMKELLAAAPVAASASKDFAQANSMAAAVPNQQAPNIFS